MERKGEGMDVCVWSSGAGPATWLQRCLPREKDAASTGPLTMKYMMYTPSRTRSTPSLPYMRYSPRLGHSPAARRLMEMR